ncbi:MAG: hypothetical protein JOY64_13320 [Alphaproteobacteria bacterium]|nr:hypothetical protein [Alphaproteobacteria bacterium]
MSFGGFMHRMPRPEDLMTVSPFLVSLLTPSIAEKRSPAGPPLHTKVAESLAPESAGEIISANMPSSTA